MMRKSLTLVLFLFGQLAVAATYEINRDHSHVSFKIPYMSYSEVEGSFTDYKGTVDFDPKTEVIKNIQGSINAASINTQDKKRDLHLRGPDFFNVKKYPTIDFKFAEATRVAPHKFKIKGALEIRGISRNVVLDAEYRGSKTDHVGRESLFFKGTTEINRKDFGIIWNKSLDKSEFLLGDEVKIEIIIQAQPLGKKTAFSTQQIPSSVALENLARYRRGEIDRPQITETPRSVPELPSVPKAMVSKNPPVMIAKTAQQQSESSLVVEMVIGFLGFCVLIVFGLLVKNKISHWSKVSNYSESSLVAISGDVLIIGMTFLYSIWYFSYLYP